MFSVGVSMSSCHSPSCANEILQSATAPTRTEGWLSLDDQPCLQQAQQAEVHGFSLAGLVADNSRIFSEHLGNPDPVGYDVAVQMGCEEYPD